MNTTENNIILDTDSYKFTHVRQYRRGTEKIYSYFESRVGARFKETVFFGLQIILKKYLEGQVVTQEKIDEAQAFVDAHLGPGIFNREGWQYILEKHGGRLPVRIKAVPEGTVVPVDNVMMTVENTDPQCFWLTNYLETLLVQVWYPSTVATLSRDNKKTILKYLRETGDPALIDFKCHDFGFRGVSSKETAGIGGCAHLVNFLGTDTAAGICYARDFYGEPMAGFSIPASEHSTITSWPTEVEAFENMLDIYPSEATIACVSDSYDIEKACRQLWGTRLREKVLARRGTLVVRPDSGEPTEMVPKVLKWLAEMFGAEKNDKGYLVLNPRVRVIQGDGVTNDSIGRIYEAVKKAGFSADNLAVGSGGGLLQKVDRDTQRFAFKCSSTTVGGQDFDVFKSPASDMTKASKRGRLQLTMDEDGRLYTCRESEAKVPLLHTVFEDGKIVHADEFKTIRIRAAQGL